MTVIIVVNSNETSGNVLTVANKDLYQIHIH